MDKADLTYDDLKARAEDRWRAIAATRQEAFAKLTEDLAQSADVKMAPNPREPWSWEGIRHDCGGTSFSVDHWVTISGKRHRWSGVCLTCQQPCVWDWGEARWLGL